MAAYAASRSGSGRRCWGPTASLPHHLAVVLVCLLLSGLTVACSASRPKSSGSPAGSATQGSGDDVVVSGDGSVRAEVATIGTVEGGPGSVTAGATLRITPVAVTDPPSVVDDVEIISVATGMLVEVERGRIQKALTVTFQAVVPGEGSSLVALHRGADSRWELIPSSPSAGGRLVVVTDRFSIVTWAVAKVLKPIGDFMAAKLAGRTSPPTCQGAPAWASVDGSPSGSTHACMRVVNPLADGTAIAELEIKSNRGTYQWVDLPTGVRREYVWVEDESDVARALIRWTFGRGESILLAPGQSMTVGYRQPLAPSQLRFRTYVDTCRAF